MKFTNKLEENFKVCVDLYTELKNIFEEKKLYWKGIPKTIDDFIDVLYDSYDDNDEINLEEIAQLLHESVCDEEDEAIFMSNNNLF
jgi:hypothetical protein